MDKYRFGNYLTSLRTQCGLSQSELGAVVGVSNKAISKWENGEALPRLERMKVLADYFGVTVEELIGGGAVSKAAHQAEPDLTPRFGIFDEEEQAEKEALADRYFQIEIHRAVWGHRWTVITLLADYAVIWLVLFPLLWLEYDLTLPHPLGAAIVRSVLYTLPVLIEHCLIWRGYDWMRWVRIFSDFCAILEIVGVVSVIVNTDAGLDAVIVYIVAIIGMLRLLWDIYLFAFYRPVKDFLAEQREYYG